MRLPTNEKGEPTMGYFGPEPAPGDLEIVERPDEACFVCSAKFRDGDRGLVIPYKGPGDRFGIAAHLECWRLLIRS